MRYKKEERSVYRMVRTALENGSIKRPNKCERCNKYQPPCKDGRSRIHAHHHDYSKPFDIEWICAACHRQETPLPSKENMGCAITPCYGERNGATKLNQKAVNFIRKSKKTGAELSIIYGVSTSAISRVRTFKYWNAATKENV